MTLVKVHFLEILRRAILRKAVRALLLRLVHACCADSNNESIRHWNRFQAELPLLGSWLKNTFVFKKQHLCHVLSVLAFNTVWVVTVGNNKLRWKELGQWVCVCVSEGVRIGSVGVHNRLSLRLVALAKFQNGIVSNVYLCPRSCLQNQPSSGMFPLVRLKRVTYCAVLSLTICFSQQRLIWSKSVMFDTVRMIIVHWIRWELRSLFTVRIVSRIFLTN